MVERRPPEAALKQQTQNVGGQTSDVIELTYNPKQIYIQRRQQQRRDEALMQELDYVEPTVSLED